MTPGYRRLLDALVADPDPIVAAVVADVVDPGGDRAAVELLVRPAVTALLAGLRDGPGIGAADRERLRRDGAEAARRGEPVAAPLDRYLSAGWAIWDVATQHPLADPTSLAALGAALLRAGDAAAAAIAEGHGEAERELASRTAAALRAFADDLLDLVPGDRDAALRLATRAAGLGIDPYGSRTAVVAWLGRDVDDADPQAERVGRAFARPPRRPSRDPATGRSPAATGGGPRSTTVASDPAPVVAARRGRLVLVLAESRASDIVLRPLLAELAEGRPWVAVRAPSVDRLELAGAAAADALAALRVVERIGDPERIVPVGAVDLERALLADRGRMAAAVEHELGPILGAPRNGPALLVTLERYLAERQNVRATARALGVAPRTVTYRLDRVERLLGHRLDGPALRRLATAMLARDLLAATA
jgi:hypothetical protein